MFFLKHKMKFYSKKERTITGKESKRITRPLEKVFAGHLTHTTTSHSKPRLIRARGSLSLDTIVSSNREGAEVPSLATGSLAREPLYLPVAGCLIGSG